MEEDLVEKVGRYVDTIGSYCMNSFSDGSKAYCIYSLTQGNGREAILSGFVAIAGDFMTIMIAGDRDEKTKYDKLRIWAYSATLNSVNFVVDKCENLVDRCINLGKTYV